jgi:hypothetical protein
VTDLEDAVAREHSAGVMHTQLLEALDRGEPVGCLAQHAHTEWVQAKNHLAGVAFAAYLATVTA